MPVILQHRHDEATPNKNGSQLRRLLEVLPTAAYTCDAKGLIADFNRRALELWGRAPKLHDPIDRY